MCSDDMSVGLWDCRKYVSTMMFQGPMMIPTQLSGRILPHEPRRAKDLGTWKQFYYVGGLIAGLPKQHTSTYGLYRITGTAGDS